MLDMLIDIFELFNFYRFFNREYLEEKELNFIKEELNVIDLESKFDKINYNYKLVNEKFIYMIRRFIRDGFIIFW